MGVEMELDTGQTPQQEVSEPNKRPVGGNVTRNVTRRAFLRGVLAGGAGALLAACGVPTQETETNESRPTQVPLTTTPVVTETATPSPTPHNTPVAEISTSTPEAEPKPIDVPVGINGSSLFEITKASSPEEFHNHVGLPEIRDSFVQKLNESGIENAKVMAIEGYDQNGTPRSDVISFIERNDHTYGVIGAVEGQNVESLRYMDITDLQATGVIGGDIQIFKDWAYNPGGTLYRDRWVLGKMDGEDVIPLGALTTFYLRGLATENEMGSTVANLITLREDNYHTVGGESNVYAEYGLPPKPEDAEDAMLSINALTGRFELHIEDDNRGVPNPTELQYTLVQDQETGELVWNKVTGSIETDGVETLTVVPKEEAKEGQPWVETERINDHEVRLIKIRYGQTIIASEVPLDGEVDGMEVDMYVPFDDGSDTIEAIRKLGPSVIYYNHPQTQQQFSGVFTPDWYEQFQELVNQNPDQTINFDRQLVKITKPVIFTSLNSEYSPTGTNPYDLNIVPTPPNNTSKYQIEVVNGSIRIYYFEESGVLDVKFKQADRKKGSSFDNMRKMLSVAEYRVPNPDFTSSGPELEILRNNDRQILEDIQPLVLKSVTLNAPK